jgi:hypothetical protein
MVAACSPSRSVPAAPLVDTRAQGDRAQESAEHTRIPNSGPHAEAPPALSAPIKATEATLKSSELAVLAREVQPAYEAAQRATVGLHFWNEDHKDVAGVTVQVASYQLGSGQVEDQLRRAVTVEFGSSANAGSTEIAIRSLQQSDARHAFDGSARADDAAGRSIGEFAESLVRNSQARRGLDVFQATVVGATARNSGVAIVDLQTREAVWYFARAVRMTTDRR